MQNYDEVQNDNEQNDDEMQNDNEQDYDEVHNIVEIPIERGKIK